MKNKFIDLTLIGGSILILNILNVKIFGFDNSNIIQCFHYLGFSLVMIGMVFRFKYLKQETEKSLFFPKINSVLLSLSMIFFSFGFVMMFIKFLLSLGTLVR